MPIPTFAHRLAGLLARAYPAGEPRQRAAAFLDDALADEWSARRWRGVGAIVVLTLRDVGRVRTGTAALPITRARPHADQTAHHSRSSPMDRWFADVRDAWRGIRRAPGVASLAVVTLALGIGASTAVYAVVDGAILRPFPYPDMPSIMLLGEIDRESGQNMSVSWPNFQDWRARQDVFRELGVYRGTTVNMAGHETPERLSAALVSASVFDTMGVPPLRGRPFTAADDERGVARTAIISERLWRSRFGASEAIVGTSVSFNNETFTVVGVMPAPMRFPSRLTDVWLPLGLFVETFPSDRGNHPGLYAIGRLEPGVSLDQATSAMDAIARQLATEYPDSNRSAGITVESYFEAIVRDIRPAMNTLLGAVGLLVLMACANVAALLLARTEHRHREIAVRAALGAGRSRLLSQLLGEGVLLATAAGVLGTMLAYGAVRGFVATQPSTIPRVDLLGIDWRVLVFATAVSLGTAMLFGVLPALRASRPHLQDALREHRTTASGGSLRLRHVLVAAQVAIAVVLLIGAGLLTRSLRQMLDIDVGFDPSRVVIGRVALANAAYPTAGAWTGFFDRAVERLHAVPGVTAIGISSAVPLEGGAAESPVMKEGDPPPSPDRRMRMCMFQTTGGEYFRAMGIPVRRGRTFDARDTGSSPGVVIVDESLVAQMFPGIDPIGKRIAFEAEGVHQKDMRPIYREIVGVVGTVKHYGLQSARDFVQVYVPHTQLPLWSRERRPTMAIVARVADGARTDSVVSSVRHAIAELDPTLPVYGVQPMTYFLNAELEQPRLASGLLVGFGSLAVLLALVGIHGLLSYAVALRTREIGVRMALGASRQAILRQVLGRGLLLTAIGLAAGLALSLGVSRWLASQLYQVSPTDLATYAAVSGLVLAVTAIASALPARKASAVDPLRALRTE